MMVFLMFMNNGYAERLIEGREDKMQLSVFIKGRMEYKC